MNSLNLTDKYQGAFLGLACGDAIGTTAEFMPRGTFEPITDMVGGGHFDLIAGQWTDDTSMALCLAHSLLLKGTSDPKHQMQTYLEWYNEGKFSSTGACFDIGNTVLQSLLHYERTGNINTERDPKKAGNGALMRLAPLVLMYRDCQRLFQSVVDSSVATHPNSESVTVCVALANMLVALLNGESKNSALHILVDELDPENLKGYSYLSDVLNGSYKSSRLDDLKPSSYLTDTLECALWAFYHNDDFESTVLAAANLGGDADTIAAIAGQMAGAYYGKSGIPKKWLKQLYMSDTISNMAEYLLRINQDFISRGGGV